MKVSTLLYVFLLWIWSGNTWAELQIPNDGNDWKIVGSEVGDDYTDLPSAVTAGEQYILVRNGTYTLNTSLHIQTAGTQLIGESKEGVIIDSAAGVCTDMLHLDADNITVSEITVKQTPSCDYTAIVSANRHHVTVQNSIVHGSDNGFAIYFAGPEHTVGQQPLDMLENGQLDSNNQVLNNIIYSNSPTDVLSFSLQKDGLVKGNTLHGGMIALFLDRDVICEDNTLINPVSAGIFLSLPSYDVTIRNNTISNPVASGILSRIQVDHVDTTGQSLTTNEHRSTGIIIQNNRIENAQFQAIEISNLKHSTIAKNTITAPSHSGIYLLRSDDLYIAHNTITDAAAVAAGVRATTHEWGTSGDAGIHIDAFITDSLVSHNTFNGASYPMQRGININPGDDVGNTNIRMLVNRFLGDYLAETIRKGNYSNSINTIVSADSLEEEAWEWGGYEEGTPTWKIENSIAHAPNGKALNCGLTGGAPYSNIHCYRNLPADPDARYFSLELDFFVPETTFNNQGGPSKIQALEFTMNQWQDEYRHEWALQWMNVGSGGPQWRYWDPHQPDSERWVPLNIAQTLTNNTWHHLRLEGEIRDGKTFYRYFVIDGIKHELNITLNPFSTPGNPDLLAVAVQADGNYAQDAYDFLIDNVHFYHTPDRRLDVASSGSHFRMIGNKIFDPQGNLFVPKGVNIFPWHGDQDSVEYISGPWNFNTVRLHSWILPNDTDTWKDHIVYLDEPLIFDPDNIGSLRTYDVRALIESYTSRGVVVLFDVHDLLGKYFEEGHLADYQTFITDFANKFKDNPYVWIDLHNEPGTYQGAGNTDQGIPANDFSRWRAQYEAMRSAVRSVAPNMPIFASGNAWGQDTGPNWNGNELVVTEESALLSNADFFTADPQLAGTIHVYDQWNYGNDQAGRLSNYFDRVLAATRSPLLIGEFGYGDNHANATEALFSLLNQPAYQHIGRLGWVWSANDNNDLTTDTTSKGSGAAIDALNSKPGNLTRLGELLWEDTHKTELDSDNDGTPNMQDLDDDNDDMPDLWELEYGLDSSNPTDATADNDGDGSSNLEEYQQGRNPNDPSDASNVGKALPAILPLLLEE